LISDQIRMMRLTASRIRTSDDIKASDHTTRTAPASGNGPSMAMTVPDLAQQFPGSGPL
jgi:hypothetical protein